MNDWYICEGGKRWILCRVIGKSHGLDMVELHLTDPATGKPYCAYGKARKAIKDWGWGWLVDAV
jgi:hypothetical protein